MEVFADNPKAACGCISACVLLAVVVAGIAYCAGTVEPIAYGLKYNTLSRNIDQSFVYEGGWFIIGPFNKFIQFPMTQVNYDFSDLPGAKQKPIDAKSGVAITMSFSFQYQLIKEMLPSLYEQYNVRYENELIRTTAIGIVKEEATNYNVSDYYTKRQEIGEAMRIALDKNLKYARCVGFQLHKVE